MTKAPISLKPRGLFSDMKSLPPSEAYLSAAPGSSATVASYPFSEGVIVDIRIEGLIDIQSDPRARPINYSGGLDYKGINVPNSTGCYLRAYVSFSSIPGPASTFGGYNNCLIPREMTDYSMQVRVGGTGTAHRGSLPYSNHCDGPCTYTATGQQRIR